MNPGSSTCRGLGGAARSDEGALPLQQVLLEYRRRAEHSTEERTRDAGGAILESYPTITVEAINAAIAYAADLARERVIALPA